MAKQINRMRKFWPPHLDETASQLVHVQFRQRDCGLVFTTINSLVLCGRNQTRCFIVQCAFARITVRVSAHAHAFRLADCTQYRSGGGPTANYMKQIAYNTHISSSVSSSSVRLGFAAAIGCGFAPHMPQHARMSSSALVIKCQPTNWLTGYLAGWLALRRQLSAVRPLVRNSKTREKKNTRTHTNKTVHGVQHQQLDLDLIESRGVYVERVRWLHMLLPRHHHLRRPGQQHNEMCTDEAGDCVAFASGFTTLITL